MKLRALWCTSCDAWEERPTGAALGDEAIATFRAEHGTHVVFARAFRGGLVRLVDFDDEALKEVPENHTRFGEPPAGEGSAGDGEPARGEGPTR